MIDEATIDAMKAVANRNGFYLTDFVAAELVACAVKGFEPSGTLNDYAAQVDGAAARLNETAGMMRALAARALDSDVRNFLAALDTGEMIVPTSAVPEMVVAHARACGRMIVLEDGRGYVRVSA